MSNKNYRFGRENGSKNFKLKNKSYFNAVMIILQYINVKKAKGLGYGN